MTSVNKIQSVPRACYASSHHISIYHRSMIWKDILKIAFTMINCCKWSFQAKQQIANMEFSRRLAVEKDLEKSPAFHSANISKKFKYVKRNKNWLINYTKTFFFFKLPKTEFISSTHDFVDLTYNTFLPHINTIITWDQQPVKSFAWGGPWERQA